MENLVFGITGILFSYVFFKRREFTLHLFFKGIQDPENLRTIA